jgi:competence protein ComEC
MAPLLWITSAWLLGLFLQGWLSFNIVFLWVGAGLFLAFSLLYALLNRRTSSRYPVLLPLCLMLVCLAALRYEWSLPPTGPENITYWAGVPGSIPEVRVTGIVSSDPFYTESGGSYRLNTRQIWPPGADGYKNVSGDIYVTLKPGDKPEPGQLLELSGKLIMPSEYIGDSFPFRQYLNRQGMYAVLSKPESLVLEAEQNFFLFRWLNNLQNGSLDIINNNVEPREAGLLGGILLGEQRGINPTVKENFRLTGSTHIVAISGANITIAIGAMMFIFNRVFRKRTALLFSLVGVIAYVLLVGASPGVIRAGVMGSFAVVGLLLGREYIALYGLAGTALLATLFSPAIFYDIGFQLSCVATLGLLLVAHPLLAQPWAYKLPPIYREGVIVSFSAELFVLPLSIYYFKQASLLSIPTGVFALPALTFVMAAGGLLIAGGWLFGAWLPVVVKGLGWVAWLPTTYMIEVVNFFAGIPFASFTIPAIQPIWLVCYYVALGLILLLMRTPRYRQEFMVLARSRVVFGLLGLGVAIILAALLL